MSDLKPCAHCGEMPVMQHISDSLFDCGIFAYWVVCPNCGIRTQRSRNQEEVIKAWNRRAKDEPEMLHNLSSS